MKRNVSFREVQVGHQQDFFTDRLDIGMGVQESRKAWMWHQGCDKVGIRLRSDSMAWEGFSNLDDSVVYKCLRTVFAWE